MITIEQLTIFIDNAKQSRTWWEENNLGEIKIGDKTVDLSSDKEIAILNTWIDVLVNKRDKLMGLKR